MTVEQEELPLPEALSAELGRIGLEFLAQVLEIEVRARPRNLDALIELAHTCTKLGLIGRGLEVDRDIVLLVPEDETARYNLACSLALSGQTDEAFEALERAVEFGYDDPDHLEEDDDLALLREDPRFAILVSKLRLSS